MTKPPVKLGCSYFGNRILKHAVRDFEELKEFGCTYIVHTYSENDHVFCKQAVADLVAASREMGFETWIDPWGVGKVFGGEAFSNFVMQNVDAMQMVSDGKPTGSACPNHPKFREFMKEWTDAAAEAKPDIFFWDEPHFYLPGWMGGRPGTYGCVCGECRKKFEGWYNKPFPDADNEEFRAFKERCIVEFLTELVAGARAHGARNALCVLPLRDAQHSTANWERLAGIPGLDIFGTDPYWLAFQKDVEEFVRPSCQLVREVCEQHGLEAQMWLQGFKVPAGREPELVRAVEIMLEEGMRNLAVWGFDACRHLSWIRPDNPDLTWETVKDAFRTAAKAP